MTLFNNKINKSKKKNLLLKNAFIQYANFLEKCVVSIQIYALKKLKLVLVKMNKISFKKLTNL